MSLLVYRSGPARLVHSMPEPSKPAAHASVQHHGTANIMVMVAESLIEESRER
jgi:hypothetical protein